MEFLTTQRLVGALGGLDLVVLAAAVGLLFVIAYAAGRRETDTRDFFLGNRRIPALVVCFSFVATEVSALTIIGVPATAYHENWNYLQFFVGSAAARVFVAFVFLPVFYKHDCTSIYEFLRDRFGAQSQYAGTIFFFLTRLMASGVRLYAACLGVSVIMGLSLEASIALFTAVSIAFIAFGGIKAVVWNGAYQAIVFYLAGGAVVVYLLTQIQGGLPAAWQSAEASGKLDLFKFDWNLNDPTTFWAGSANAFFIGLAIFGTDQELVQRLLTVRTRRSSQRAILGTIAAGLPVVCIYLAIGTLLFVFYQQNSHLPVPPEGEYKKILSHFVAQSLPLGLKGLVLAAIVLASIDSPLSSLSTSFVTDIYRPLVRRGGSERHYLVVSRLGVVGFGAVLGAIALACQSVQDILWFAFEVISVTGGSLLGVFLLGLLTRRRGTWGNVVAMVANSLVIIVLMLLSKDGVFAPQKVLNLGWSWLIVIGTVFTFVLAYILGPVLGRGGAGGSGAATPSPACGQGAATSMSNGDHS